MCSCLTTALLLFIGFISILVRKGSSRYRNATVFREMSHGQCESKLNACGRFKRISTLGNYLINHNIVNRE